HRERPPVRHPVPPGEVRRRGRRTPPQLARHPRLTARPHLRTFLPPGPIRFTHDSDAPSRRYVSDGQAVRLVQGEAGTETSYGAPLEAALAWQRAGAEWIHLVDLDAAFGRGSNRELLAEVTGKLDVKVELSGGIRDDASLEAALATGCARVNIGTAALEDPEWCRKIIATHGEKIAVGLDVRGATLAARGWTREGGNLWEVLERLEKDGCPRYVVTDVTKDGTLRGPNT